MRKEPNKKKIGIFVLVGFSFLIFSLFFYLKEKIFPDQDNILVMYFEESIKGLNIGSPVVFKGVEIGKVVKISLLGDSETLEFSIPVYIQINKSGVLYFPKQEENRDLILDELINKGLRARLTTQSYLTGQLMIELEMLPDTKIVLRAKPFDEDIIEIPTVLSTIGALSKDLQDINIKESLDRVNIFFDSLNNNIMPQVESIVGHINKTFQKNPGIAIDTVNNLNRTLENVGEAARSLRNFADYIERHTEALLQWKGEY